MYYIFTLYVLLCIPRLMHFTLQTYQTYSSVGCCTLFQLLHSNCLITL